MKIIPAIDILGGKCVRLTRGDYNNISIYNENPVEVARVFEDHGIRYLHLVDLDGARSERIINWKILDKITSTTNLEVDFGGGIKNDKDIRIAIDNGAKQVTAGSVAANKPELFLKWLELYGPDKIILGADCRDRKIMTNGWTFSTEIDIIHFIKNYQSEGIVSVICTDIEKDGMMKGPSFDLYKEIIEKTDTDLIASGGITTLQDLEGLEKIGCEGAIIGRSIYEGSISLSKLGEL